MVVNHVQEKNGIEFDGEQHFTERWHGEKKLKDTQQRDEIKNNYCKNNNINLLRIRFDENIIDKLNETFNI